MKENYRKWEEKKEFINLSIQVNSQEYIKE